MTALTHAVVDGGMASHLAFSIGAIAQLAEVPDCLSGGCGFKSRWPR